MSKPKTVALKKTMIILLCTVMTVMFMPAMALQNSYAAENDTVSNGFYEYTELWDGTYKVSLTEGFKSKLNNATASERKFSGEDATGNTYYWAENGTGDGSTEAKASSKLPNPDPDGMYNGKIVSSMKSMFSNCSNTIKLDLSNFDTYGVENMAKMFSGCEKLKSVDVSSFATTGVSDMSYMFQSCYKLESLDISSFSILNAHGNTGGLLSMFAGTCRDATGAPIKGYAKDDEAEVYFNNTSNQAPNGYTEIRGSTGIDTAKLKFEFDSASNDFYSYAHDGSTKGYRVRLTDGFEAKLNNATSSEKKFEGTDANGDHYYWSAEGTGDGTTEAKASSRLPNPAPNGQYNNREVTSMAVMFASGSDNITKLDLSDFDTSKVTDMSVMFQSCTKLKKIDVSSFDTSKVTDMSAMFNMCENLEILDVSNFDTSKVTDMRGMFQACNNLENLDVSSFDTSKVTYMSYMFNNCDILSSIDVSNFDTSKVMYMSQMFQNCYKLSSLDISNFDLSSIEYNGGAYDGLTKMFYGTCKDAPGTPITGYAMNSAAVAAFNNNTDSAPIGYAGFLGNTGIDTAKLKFEFDSTSNDFYSYAHKGGTTGYRVSLTEGFKAKLNNATASERKFSGEDATGAIYYWAENGTGDGSAVDKASSRLPNPAPSGGYGSRKVTSMAFMFNQCGNITKLDLSNFDTSNVTSMRTMFQYCGKLEYLDISSFYTSKVTEMRYMFNQCENLEILDVSNLDTSKVTNMNRMFQNCYKLSSLDISNFDLSSIEYNGGAYDGLTDMFDGTCKNATGTPITGYAKNSAAVAAFNNNTDSAPSGYTEFLGNTKIDTDKLKFSLKPAPFYQVTDIAGVPSSFDEDTSIELAGTVEPSYATRQEITWAIKDAGTTGAKLTGNVLRADKPGTIVIIATVKDGLYYGSDYTRDISITVNDVGDQVSLLKASTSAGSKNATLRWTGVTGADRYVVYGARCGKDMKKLKTLDAGTLTYQFRKLQKGKTYKYRLLAYDADGKRLCTSLSVHAAVGSSHGRYNASKVTAAKTLTMTLGKTVRIKASVTSSHGKNKVLYRGHCSKLRYVAKDDSVVSVSGTGVVTGLKAGVTSVYVIAPNGVRTAVEVTVK